MIINILAGLILALVFSHIIISFVDTKPTKKIKHIPIKYEYKNNQGIISPEVVYPLAKETSEKEFLNYGKVIANEQKIKLIDLRINELESVLATLSEEEIKKNEKNKAGFDFEKIDFKIKVLEQEIEKIKNPKEKPKTFYGKENDPMEETIKSLVFNSKKK
jgi:hypothetical protein